MTDAAPLVTTERELKLSAWPEFTLPDLDGVIKGARAVAADETSLEAVYIDTADLRLLRRGVTVRFRRGEAGGDVWTVKLPELATRGLTRREVSLAGAPGTMPGLLRDLTRGWALGAALQRVATIRTNRRTIRLLDRDDQPIAVIDDDDVRGLRGRRVAARFRELEIELAPTAPGKALQAVDRALQAAGALPAPQVPKLARTVGPVVGDPWDLAPPELPARPTAGELLRARIVDAVASIADRHAAVVLDEDPGAVMSLAESIGRLSGDLRVFDTLLDAEVVAELGNGLAQAARVLGAACDDDAVITALRADASDAALGDAAHAVIDAMSDARDGSHERAAALLRSPRYGALLARLRQFALNPPLKPKAKRRAERTVPALAGSAVRGRRDDLRRAATSPDVLPQQAAEFRHAVELAAQFAGKPADRARRDADALVGLVNHVRRDRATAKQLEALAAAADARTAWAAGVLAGIALQRAEQTADRAASAISQLDRKSRWSWLP